MSYFEKVYIRKYDEITIDAPIQIMESAIIKDTVDNIVYLRNIFTNVSRDTIIAIVIEGIMYDIAGERVEENDGNINYTYQDIEIESNDIFGNKIPISLPGNVRKVDISIKKIVKKSGEVIDYSGFSKRIPDGPEYIKISSEYIKSISENNYDPIIYPIFNKDYWQCTCGRINWNKDNVCGLCKRSIDDQITFEKSNLQKAYDEYVEECNIKRIEEEKRIEQEKQKKIEEDRKKKEAEEREQEHKKQLELERRRKNTKIAIICASIVSVLIIVLVVIFVVIPNLKYKDAKKLMESQSYLEAINDFKSIDETKYAHEIEECEKLYIEDLKINKNYDVAIEYLVSVMGQPEISDDVKECKYLKANELLINNKYDDALYIFQELSTYKESKNKVNECKYGRAGVFYENGDYESALSIYKDISGYSDSKEKARELEKEITYNSAMEKLDSKKYVEFVNIMDQLGNFKDAKKLIGEYKELGSKELFDRGEYSKCVEFCSKYEIHNDYFYDSKYKYGMYLYNLGDLSNAWNYLVGCEEKYPDTEKLVIECENEKKYIQATKDAQNGSLDSAIEKFSAISGYKDSSSWLAKCNEAKRYTGTFSSYMFKIYDDDGDIHDIPPGQNYGDAKNLTINATINSNLEIIYSANGKRAEPGSLYIYYHKYSDSDESTIDIAARTITTQYYHSNGAKSDKYVAWYE